MHPMESNALLQDGTILEDEAVALGLWKPISLFDPQQRAHQQPFAFCDVLMFPGQFFFAFRVLFSPLARFFFLHARRLSAPSSLFQGT